MKRRLSFLIYTLIIIVVAIPLSTLLARPRGQTTGLVAAYAFDEGDGQPVLDASGNNNNGTLLGGAKYSRLGMFGSALLLRGGNYTDSVTIPDSSSLDLSSTMTIEAWVYPFMQQDWQTIILKESEVGLRYGLYANSDTNTPAVGLEVSGYGYIETRNTYPLPVQEWTHLATTFDGTTLTLYINGSPVSSAIRTGGIDTSPEPLRIGGNAIWGEYFSGRIDNVRIYNRSLNIAEIQTDMDTPVGSNIPTPTPTSPPYPEPFQVQPQIQTDSLQEPYAFLPLVLGNVRRPGDAYYVLPNWDEPVTYQGITGSRAYVEGFFADINTPILDGSEPMTQLILAFGRQRLTENNWGVLLTHTSDLTLAQKDNTWVQWIVQDFMNGYVAGHPNSAGGVIPAVIATGTSNDNVPWACDNDNATTLAPEWEQAGAAWGNLINNISAPVGITKKSAIDIEVWYDASPPPWGACGLGVLAWYGDLNIGTGYIGHTFTENINFGDNPYIVNDALWSVEQVYKISYGLPQAYVSPQIYCLTHRPNEQRNRQLQGWVQIRDYNYIKFNGVTSTNSQGWCDKQAGIHMVDWDAAWHALDDALTSAPSPGPYPNSVKPMVSSYFYKEIFPSPLYP